MASSDLKYDSKILVLGSANVGKAELISAVKSRIENRYSFSDSVVAQETPVDYRYEELSLPLVDKENVFASEVRCEVYISSNRLNHCLNLKNAYKTAEYIIFVFDISLRQSFEDLNRYMNDYLVLGRRPNASILLIGHYRDSQLERKVSTEEILAWSSVTRTESAIRYIECSANTGSGILELTSFLSEQYQTIYWAALSTTSDKTVSFVETLPNSAHNPPVGPVSECSSSLGDNENQDLVDSDAELEKKRKLEQFEKSMAESLEQDRRELGTHVGDADDTFDPAVLLSHISAFFGGVSNYGDGSSNGSTMGGGGSTPRNSTATQSSPRARHGVTPSEGISGGSNDGVHNEVAIDWNNVKSIIEMSYDDTEDDSRVERGSQYTLKSKRTASTEISTGAEETIQATKTSTEQQGCWDSLKCTRWWECIQDQKETTGVVDHDYEEQQNHAQQLRV